MNEHLKTRIVDLLFLLAAIAIGLWAWESVTVMRSVDALMTGQCQQIGEAVKANIEKAAVEKHIAENKEEE